jgi:hypothetical protein
VILSLLENTFNQHLLESLGQTNWDFNMHRLIRFTVAVLLCSSASALQSSQILVDMGGTDFPTNGIPVEAWNDVDASNMGTPFELIDTNGASSGVGWELICPLFTGSNNSGTNAPQAGSLLDEFPPSATRDVLYGQNGSSVTVELTGFAPDTLASFTFAAARLSVSDMRTTDYVVQGFNAGLATLDPSNNVTETVTVSGIVPDPSGTISITMRAALANNNSEQYFYIGAIQIDLENGGTVPQLIGFDQPALSVSVADGSGLFNTDLTVLENMGATPNINLSAIDDSTGMPPTWLSLPPSASVGLPITATFDESVLPTGSYSATVTAASIGYPDSTLSVTYQIGAGTGLNLLFYGNSYSQGNSGVPALAGFIAEDAGYASPNVVAKLVGGQNLFFHLTDPNQVAAITTALPLGQSWDYVVMQGHSLEATNQYGAPAAFRANALSILTNVKAHSPSAKAVMYQTWARGPGFSGYPNTYVDPFEMHGDIHANYQLAVDDMNAAFGAGTAFLGRAGDAVALLEFDPSLYVADQSHPTAPTSLMASMSIFQAIYRKGVCDITPDFGTTTNLINRLNSLGIALADWNRYGGIAERIADTDVRRWPGSSEQLLLSSGINGGRNSCPTKIAGNLDVISATLTSPNDLYVGMPSFVILDPFLTGNTPGLLDPWPELHIHAPSAFFAKQTQMLGSSLTYTATIPGSFPGVSLLLQGLTLAPSPTTGNPAFTTTDAHEFILQ